MKAIAINDIPLFEGSDIFRATVGMEYECEIKLDRLCDFSIFIIIVPEKME